MYNLTNITGANDLYNIILHTNRLSGDVLIVGMMFILFILYLVIYKGTKFKQVLPAATFFMTLVSIYAFVMELVGTPVLITSIILFFASLMIYYFVK
jgi:hypothetical protein